RRPVAALGGTNQRRQRRRCGLLGVGGQGAVGHQAGAGHEQAEQGDERNNAKKLFAEHSFADSFGQGGRGGGGKRLSRSQRHGGLQGQRRQGGWDRGGGIFRQQWGEHGRRQGDAAPAETIAQDVAGAGQPALDRAGRPIELLGGFFVGLALQVAEDHR